MGIENIRNLKAKASEPKEPTYGMRRVSEKAAKKKEDDKELLAKDKLFYAEVWRNNLHKCENCGCGLGNTWKPFNFHHLLPKADYPQFRHNPDNIAVLCLTCHSKCETDISFAPAMQQLTKETEILLLS